jgi:hypothetical protein
VKLALQAATYATTTSPVKPAQRHSSRAKGTSALLAAQDVKNAIAPPLVKNATLTGILRMINALRRPGLQNTGRSF